MGRTQQAASMTDNSQNGVAISAPEDRGIRRIIRNFTPSWFAVTMGTGIVSILLHNLPYNATWLYWISVIFFALNVFLFIVFLIISIARYVLYPEIWSVMVRHPTQSLFLGTFPMGLATIVNMVVFVCVPSWGPRAITLVWALWWIDVVIAVTVCFWMPFVLCALHPLPCSLTNRSIRMTLHEVKITTMTAAWLLPIVATIVAAGSGGVVANVLPNPHHALWTITGTLSLTPYLAVPNALIPMASELYSVGDWGSTCHGHASHLFPTIDHLQITS